MSPPDVIVAIGSVPWRRENLIALLHDIAGQTVRPKAILLTLDGGGRIDDIPAIEGLQVAVSETPYGPGARWRWLAAYAAMFGRDDGGIAVVIDDDFRIDPDYIERSVKRRSWWPNRCAMAWSGAGISDGEFLSWAHNIREELLSISAGTCAIPLRNLIGISQPSADEFFRVGGDDEAWVSYWLWVQGVRMFRPDGPAPLRSVDELQDDERAGWRTRGFRGLEQRMKLRDEYGWPFKLPPALARTGDTLPGAQDWKKKPWQRRPV